MLSSKDKAILNKILEEINVVQVSTNGIDYNSFMSNEDKKRATSMTLINIGELVHILSKDFKNSIKDIPFDAIKATRNIAVHGYHALDFRVIWNTIQISIPDLKQKIKGILKN